MEDYLCAWALFVNVCMRGSREKEAGARGEGDGRQKKKKDKGTLCGDGARI